MEGPVRRADGPVEGEITGALDVVGGDGTTYAFTIRGTFTGRRTGRDGFSGAWQFVGERENTQNYDKQCRGVWAIRGTSSSN